MAQKSVLRYIILGLLAQQDLAGCDIKKMFEGELGDFWHSNHSQIYPELRKMETDGLIEYHTVLVGKKQEKKVA
jgi:DNA-binding PadR family transcriptional regulator